MEKQSLFRETDREGNNADTNSFVFVDNHLASSKVHFA